MAQTFAELGLRPELLSALADLNHETPTPIQADIIPLMLMGKDVVAQSQTGTGKTASFALPILENLAPGNNGIQALILCPTRELAIQVAKAIKEYGKYTKFNVMAIYGGQSYSEQLRNLRRGLDIVVGTPGRLLDLLEKRKAMDLSNLKHFVLDEADEMLSMGFIDDIERIIQKTPEFHQTALFSATLPKQIRNLAKKYLVDPESITIEGQELTVDSIEQKYYIVDERNKFAALTRLIETEDISSALIFARTRASSRELANGLVQRGFTTEALNGDLSQDARMQILDSFRAKKINILVATDVAARGIDIDDISHVFNYDLPDQSEVYVHRVGRTGRAGRSGTAITFVPQSKLWRINRIEKLTRKKMVEGKLPTAEEIKLKRNDSYEEKIRVWLKRGRCIQEREIVQKFIDEGVDPVELSAILLKMARAEESKRPIQELKKSRARSNEGSRGRGRDRERGSYGRDRGYGNDRNQSRSRNPGSSRTKRKYSRDSAGTGRNSSEEGMTRFIINRGRQHGIKPGEIVSSIASAANIPGSSIGKISINDDTTYVDVRENHANKVDNNNINYTIHRKDITVKKA